MPPKIAVITGPTASGKTALGVALACRVPRLIPAAVLIELASLSTYWALSIPLAAASGMMLAAIVLTLVSFACGESKLPSGKGV